MKDIYLHPALFTAQAGLLSNSGVLMRQKLASFFLFFVLIISISPSNHILLVIVCFHLIIIKKIKLRWSTSNPNSRICTRDWIDHWFNICWICWKYVQKSGSDPSGRVHKKLLKLPICLAILIMLDCEP